MIYDKLGNTDIKVSKICLGTMTWGEQNSEQEGHMQLDYAIDHGVNFIDTAEMYAVPGRKETQGETERIIGNWIEKRGKRDDFVLASKVTGPNPAMPYIRDPMNFSKAQILTAIEGSLKRLKTDYLDLYQLHWPERKTNFFGKLGFNYDPEDSWEDNFQEILLVMQELIEDGKIRHFGISNETPYGLSKYLHYADKQGLPRCVSVQNPYSLLNRTYEIGLAEMSIREEVGLLAYSPMAFGLLSGKYRNGEKPDNSRLTLFPKMARYSGELAAKATDKYSEIAQKHGMKVSQLALAWVNTRPFLTSTIIGATNMEQLKENIDSINIELDNNILEAIEDVHKEIPNPAP